jgi:hypothetical protein
MDLLLPTDGCDNCMTMERSFPVHPYRVISDGTPDGIFAFYRCPQCCLSWRTGWGVSNLALPCPGCALCTPQAGAA